MRKIFIDTLVELAEKDERIMLLTADLGFMALEPFIKRFPKRYINVGVAEQNMIGVATGLAEAGFMPFVYSIAPFAVLRPYEFIRNGPILHQLPVRIIGMGGGMDYAYSGITHYALEDIALMRVQEGMTTICPADCRQARTSLLKTWTRTGPIYYRLSKDDNLYIDDFDGSFDISDVQEIGTGEDILNISMGSIAKEAISAMRMQKKSKVLIVSNFNPSPDDAIIKNLRKCKIAITLEEHYLNGGLGSYIAELIAENDIKCMFRRYGVNKSYRGITGGLDYLRASMMGTRLMGV